MFVKPNKYDMKNVLTQTISSGFLYIEISVKELNPDTAEVNRSPCFADRLVYR